MTLSASPWPAGPPRRPLVGNLPEFARDVLGFLSECARRYGDVVPLKLGAWPVLLVNRADLAEQVLAVRYRSFECRPSLPAEPRPGPDGEAVPSITLRPWGGVPVTVSRAPARPPG